MADTVAFLTFSASEWERWPAGPYLIRRRTDGQLAYLGQARAAGRSGDAGASRQAYEALLALWQDADPDAAIVRVARHEYRQLGVRRAAGHD
jgi:hypothetical protein